MVLGDILGIVKDVTDGARHLAGLGLVGLIDGTESVLAATLGDETCEAVAERVKETGEDLWKLLLDKFVPNKEQQEAINWVLYLLAEKLESDRMTFDFFFRRKKPLAVLMLLIFKAHSLEHQSLSMNYRPLKFKKEDSDELKRLSKFCINVYQAVMTDEERDEEHKDRDAHEIMEMLDEDEILQLCDQDLHLQEGRKRSPRFMVFTDTRSESIVVAIRGTKTR